VGGDINRVDLWKLLESLNTKYCVS
jgi:hypothetical protein